MKTVALNPAEMSLVCIDEQDVISQKIQIYIFHAPSQ